MGFERERDIEIEKKKKMVLSKPTPSRPTTIRPSCPTTLISGESSECRSFSQLLAGAMAATATAPSASTSTSNSSPCPSPPTNPLPPPLPPTPAPGNGVTVRPKTVRLKSIPSHPPHPPAALNPSPQTTTSDQGEASEAQATGNCGVWPVAAGSEAPDCDSPGHKDRTKQDGGSGSNVVFKPLAKLGTRNPLPSLANLGSFGISHQQALAQVQAQARAQAQAQAQAQVQSQPGSSSSPKMTTFSMPQVLSSAMTSSTTLPKSPGFNAHSLQKKTGLQSEPKQMMESPRLPTQTTEQNQPSLPPVPVGDRPSFDGYNWRKYGQKQVKGSEYPRSYYKCTHPNCPVKKKVERSHDGQVTEIVYKGEHNHLKPQPTRRASLGTSIHEREIDSPAVVSGDKNDFDVSADQPSPGFYADPNGKTEKLANYSDPSTSVRGFGNGTGSPEQSFGVSDDGEDALRADEEDDDEPDSKRRKKDKKMKDLLASQRTSREPRVIVQTTEADILEDGFRWRKYGQKVVKGNPYPRSYYKCTSVKCTVRKHVERASDDPKAVITTYEGKHNHDAPLARNSSQDAAGNNSQLFSRKSTDVVQDKQIQYRLPTFARVSESTAEGEDRLHVGEVGAVPMMENNMQLGGDTERAFGSDDNFAV
uniref:TSA: Wollemia nobilis Ref_Wollemi_Transcript_11328_2624 transcribed RNA sequence n=1 Tax=Wollemia nobilis TaxID=56998 RepID=A0A0C9S8E8_9CONI